MMEPRPTVLIVEDDPATAMMLVDVLTDTGYRATRVATGGEALAHLRREAAPPDLIVLDLRLPDTDGLVLCATIRAHYDIPILICTANGRMEDRVLALRLGADDFIVKPFDVDELVARVQAVLRRSGQSDQRSQTPPVRAPARAPVSVPLTASVGDLMIDRARRRIRLGGADVPLTPSEYRLLAALMSRPDGVMTRDELARAMWGSVGGNAGRAIDVHVRRLRAKLGAFGAPPILTVRGSGYRLVLDRSELSA
jgi:DNA-binding response OmpR family regulator